jgi:hypothetical protein
MKLLSISLLAITLGLGAVTYTLAKPHLQDNGTAVIYVATNDGKEGNKPYTTVLPNNLSQRQLELLNFAHDVAVQDGHKYPQYVQGIIMQESKAGNMTDWRVAGLTNKAGDRYFGIGQIKLVAAKAVMKAFPDMWKYLDTKTDEELQARLILDDHFNIRVTSKYALMMGANKNPDKAITAYNQGPAGAENVNPSTWHYTVGVKQKAKELKNIPKLKNVVESSDAKLIKTASVDERYQH